MHTNIYLVIATGGVWVIELTQTNELFSTYTGYNSINADEVVDTS